MLEQLMVLNVRLNNKLYFNSFQSLQELANDFLAPDWLEH